MILNKEFEKCIAANYPFLTEGIKRIKKDGYDEGLEAMLRGCVTLRDNFDQLTHEQRSYLFWGIAQIVAWLEVFAGTRLAGRGDEFPEQFWFIVPDSNPPVEYAIHAYDYTFFKRTQLEAPRQTGAPWNRQWTKGNYRTEATDPVTVLVEYLNCLPRVLVTGLGDDAWYVNLAIHKFKEKHPELFR